MKIGSESIEIKPVNPEGFSGEIGWKSGVNVTKIEQLIVGLSSESREKSIEELEGICNKIIKANDYGLYGVCEKQFGIDIFKDGLGLATKKILEIFDRIKSGDDAYIDKVKNFIFDYKFYYFAQYEKCMSYIEEARKDFISMIDWMSSKYNIDIDPDKIKSIVEKTKVSFLDGTYFGDKFNLTSAKHVANGEIYIGLDSFSSEEGFKYIYFHEVLHATSMDYSKIIHMGYYNDPTDTQSTGVDFSGNFEDKNRGFTWLNEAFTDVFAVMMVNNDEKSKSAVYPRYKPEINLIKLLSEKGEVNFFEKMCNVYFRHTKKDDDRSPADIWRYFNKEIDTVFGPRFLVTLDIFIEKNGIEKAIEVIEGWERGKIKLDDLK